MKRIKIFFIMSWALLKAMFFGQAFFASIVTKIDGNICLQHCGVPFSKKDIELIAKNLTRILVYEGVNSKVDSNRDSETV